MKRQNRYPGIEEDEKERAAWEKNLVAEEEPDFIGIAPNYDKFLGWKPEEVLVYLNVD